MPKLAGKAKRRLIFAEDSDEEEAAPSQPKISKRAAALEEYFSQVDGKPGTSTAAPPKPPPPPQPQTEASDLPVYHLKIENFNIDDLMVQVCNISHKHCSPCPWCSKAIQIGRASCRERV